MIAVLSALVGTEQGVTPVGEDGHDELQALADGMKGQSVAHMTRSSSAWYAALEEGAILRSSPDGMSEQIGSLNKQRSVDADNRDDAVTGETRQRGDSAT